MQLLYPLERKSKKIEKMKIAINFGNVTVNITCIAKLLLQLYSKC